MAAKKDIEKNDRRGRKAFDGTPTVVRLPTGVPERIDAVAGNYKRAEFIREATVRELVRRERELERRETDGGEGNNRKPKSSS